MNDIELKDLWKSYDQKLEQSLVLQQAQALDLGKVKVQSLLRSMAPLKIFAIIVGITWVILLDFILVFTFGYSSLFFLISAAAQVLVTKIAIGIYLYQLYLIHKVNINQPIAVVQRNIAQLKLNSIWETKVSLLQLPFWTTFYLQSFMFSPDNWLQLTIQFIITAAFTYAAIWLFINVRLENRDKKWFSFLFSGREWSPLVQAEAILEELEEVA